MVTACDTMLSLSQGALTVDNLVWKRGVLARDWNVMISGNVSEASLILAKARNRSIKHGEFSTTRYKSTEIVAILVEAYQERVRERIQNEILGPYGLTFGAFNPQDNPDIRSRIDWLITHDFDCEFLLYGYEWIQDVPEADIGLFTIRSPGDVSSHELPGFWAIGSGADLALSSLAFSGQNRVNSNLASTIWNVCVAKFRSEHAFGVGHTTELVITSPDASTHLMDEGVIDELREHWKGIEETHERIPGTLFRYVKEQVPIPTHIAESERKDFGLE